MHFTRKQLGIPYILFLILFVVLPLFVVLYYAFTDGQGQFTVENFQHFFTNGKTLGTLFYSFVIALLTTTVCLFIAYPTAYILAWQCLRWFRQNAPKKNTKELTGYFVTPWSFRFFPAD